MDESFTDILTRLEKTLSGSSDFFELEYEKFIKLLKADSDKIVTKANLYKKSVFQKKQELEGLSKQVEEAKEKMALLEAKEEDYNKRVLKVAEEEEGLVKLHKVLANKKKLIDAREKEVQTRQRRTG